MTSESKCDVIVVGGGIAGMSVAYQLAKRRVHTLVLEASDCPPEHSTARSVALFSKSYADSPVISALITLSESFLGSPPDGFSDSPLLVSRETIHIAAPHHVAALGKLYQKMATFPAETKLLGKNELLNRAPILRSSYAELGILERDSGDLDPAALWAGYRRSFLRDGGRMVTGAELRRAVRRSHTWHIETSVGCFSAEVVVNAAGAWADVVAARCGVSSVGLAPLLRTALVAEPAADGTTSLPTLPFVFVPFDDLYFRAHGGVYTMSPADERPSLPADVHPDEFDIARTMAKFEEVTEVRLKNRRPKAWAGLRTFSPDRNPVVGFAPDAPGFFWLAGQGGSGIESSPAMSLLSAACVAGERVPDELAAAGLDARALDPVRFQMRQNAA